MSTEIYFLQDKKKKQKQGGTDWRRRFLLEKRSDGNGARSSKARGDAWAGAAAPRTAQRGRAPGLGDPPEPHLLS